MRVVSHARRALALDLLRLGISEGEVQLKAEVSWRVLERWCATGEDPPLTAWHHIALRAEETRAARRTADTKRAWRKDRQYRQKLEDLTEMKREYRSAEGMACEPFTQNSSDEIDALQALVDGWFVVSPELWTEDEFLAVHSGKAVERHGADAGMEAWPGDDALGLEEFDLDEEELF